MTDTPSSILLTREQSTGSNTNLWGGYLITTQRTTERATKGYQAYAVTGDATISWSNYSSANDYAVAFVKATGTPTASWTHTLPSYQTFFGNWNSTSYTGTLKNAAGTGIGVPANRKALLYSDAVDIGEATPNWISGYVSTLLNDGDIVVKKTMETAIASASGLTAPFILVDASDMTPGYLVGKVIAQTTGLSTTQVSGLVSLQIQSPGGNEKLAFAGYVGGYLNGGSQSAQFIPVVGTEYNVDCTSGSVTVNLSGMAATQLGQSIKLNKFGNNPMFLLGTVNGASNLPITATEETTLKYCGSSWGWN